MNVNTSNLFMVNSKMRVVALLILVAFSTMIFRPTIILAAESFGVSESGLQNYYPSTSRESLLFKKILQRKDVSTRRISANKMKVSEKIPEENLSIKLKYVKDKLKLMSMRNLQKSGLESTKKELHDLKNEINNLHLEVKEYFVNMKDHISANNLSETVAKRHSAWVDRYQEKIRQLFAIIDAAQKSKNVDEMASAISSAISLLSMGKHKRDHQSFNPESMPFTKNNTKPRKPLQTDYEYKRLLKESFSDDTGISSTTSTILLSSSDAGLFSKLSPPVPQDIAENEDVQITPGIIAKAAELNNDPVTIFNWVRNNISFKPTYGSMQGSRMTLEAKRGNAFDTANLLIALFRASGIPARYVIGTIRIPTDQVMNWVGNAEDSNVLQDIIGQGGIPNVGIIEGATVTSIELEHVWVEAWIDNIPSRGAVHVSGDTWVPMDASFKQYNYTPPSNLLSDVPFDLEALNTTVLATATVDNSLGKISGIDEAIVRSSFETYAETIQEYAATNSLPSTMETIIGSRVVVNKLNQQFIGGLPYVVRAKGPSIDTLPDSHRYYVTLNGYNSSIDRSLGFTSFTARVSLPALNSNRLGVSYEPATAGDAATWQSLIDTGAASISLNLINVKAVVKLDDLVLTEGPSVGMGSDQFVDVVLEGATGATTVPYQLIAGDEAVFGITGNGLTSDVIAARMDRVLSDTSAENLHQVALHYWYESDVSNQATAAGYNVHTQLLPSIGLFSSPLNVSYLFGFPNAGAYQGRFMDVKRILVSVAGVNQIDSAEFLKQAGIQGSFLEGSVFDQLFERPQGNGISAIQLIADSNAEGIPIYTVDSSNITTVLPLLSVDADVKNDISSAISAGKIAIVPESELVKGDWSGTGYILRDEMTGEGAYLISGGLNGGWLLECFKDLVPLVALVLIIIVLVALAWWALPALGAGAATAVRAMAILFAMFTATGSAYAGSSQTRSKQADPCNCPPVTPEYCEFDAVPPSKPHYPCPGDHWHVNVYNQGPAPACTEYGPYRNFGGCGSMPSPCPP